MIKLNTDNGSLQFEKHTIIKSKTHIDNLKGEILNGNLELWISNGEWITYKLEISEKFILIFRFLNELIYSVEIYYKSTDDNDRKKGLNKTLEDIGGSNEYTWGNVELNVDHKAGYQSILINYSK